MKKILLIILITFILLCLFRDVLIKKGLVFVGEKIAGTTITLDHFSMSLMKQSIRLQGLKIYQPQGFTQQVMVNVPLVSVQWRMMEMLKGKGLHFSLVELDIQELTVIKNSAGEMNFNALKVVKEQQSKNPLSFLKEDSAVDMKFDLVRLNIGKVVSMDIDQQQKILNIKEMNIYLKNKEFKRVDSLPSLCALVMVEAVGTSFLKNTVINIKGISSQAATGVLDTIGSFLK